MYLAADSTSSLLSALSTVSTILGGAGGALILLFPGWILVTVYNRAGSGEPASTPSVVGSSAFGGLLVHLTALFWTVPLAQSIIVDGIQKNVWQIAAWVAVVLLL